MTDELPTREAIARIIDPEEWALFDACVERGVSTKGLGHGRSLGKADQILALSTPIGEPAVDLTPWKNHSGPLPAYDSPISCVFDSGVQHAVELLAKELSVDDWQVCDGTEEYDGDLGGTMMNIVTAAMPEDEHGDPIWPSELPPRITRETLAKLATPQPSIAERTFHTLSDILKALDDLVLEHRPVTDQPDFHKARDLVRTFLAEMPS